MSDQAITRLIWLTDLHCDFLRTAQVDELLERVRQENPAAVLIGGDISDARTIHLYLERIVDGLQLPTYFVLGNHDFYHGSISAVRRRISQLSAGQPLLHFLTTSRFVSLTPEIGLVGHDGWADAREGDYERSIVMMNDYLLIEELAALNKQDRLAMLNELGDEGASHIRNVLPAALADHEQVFLLTHVPPLREACWYAGRISDDQWAPHFVCQAMGQAILDVMQEHPRKHLTVLCGHTHSEGMTRPAPNVIVYTGAAEYGVTSLTRRFDV